MDKDKYSREEYMRHVRESDPNKEKLYKKGYMDSRLGVAIKRVMGCFPKVGEFFLHYIF